MPTFGRPVYTDWEKHVTKVSNPFELFTTIVSRWWWDSLWSRDESSNHWLWCKQSDKINTPPLINRIRRSFWKIYYSLLAITGLVSYQEYDVAARLHSLSGLVYCRLTIDEMFWTVQWSLFMSINKAWYRKDKLSVTLICPYNNVDHLIGWCVSKYYIDKDILITLLCLNDINAVTIARKSGISGFLYLHKQPLITVLSICNIEYYLCVAQILLISDNPWVFYVNKEHSKPVLYRFNRYLKHQSITKHIRTEI